MQAWVPPLVTGTMLCLITWALVPAFAGFTFESKAAWSTSGVNGIPAAGSQGKVAFGYKSVKLKPGVEGSVTIRYPVVATQGLTGDTSDTTRMGIGFLDETAARTAVYVGLRRISNEGEASGELMYFESSSLPTKPGIRNVTINECDLSDFADFDFVFGGQAYFLEVELYRGDASAPSPQFVFGSLYEENAICST